MRKLNLTVCAIITLFLASPNLVLASYSSANGQSHGQALRIGEVNVQGLPSVKDSTTSPVKTIPNLTPSIGTIGVSSVAAGIATSSVGSAVSVTSTLDGVFGGAP